MSDAMLQALRSQVAAGEDARKLNVRLLTQRHTRIMERDFAAFFRGAWKVLEGHRPLKWNWHLTLICEFLMAFARREFHNGIINIPPRFTKSLTVGVALPAWIWLQPPEYDEEGNLLNPFVGPNHQFLCLSNDEDLALRDAGKCRDLIQSDWYQQRWGHRVDIGSTNEKGYYTTSKGGHRTSRSLGAKLTGKGGDTILIDDPHDVERVMSDLQRLADNNNYRGKVVSRLNDPMDGGKLIIMQRAHHGDLVALVEKEDGLYHPVTNAYGWLKLCLPMRFELDEPRKPPVNPAKMMGFEDPREEPGELLDAARYPLRAVETLESNLGVFKASGQLQQRPSPVEGGIIKKKWWRKWPQGKEFPRVSTIIQTWDTAFTEQHEKEAQKGQPSYSARLTLGVFHDEIEGHNALMLLDAWRNFVDYPTLRKEFKASYTAYDPDIVIIEKKASGQSLIQDARATGIPIVSYEPEGDKIARAYAVQPTVQSGLLYYPDRRWAEEVVDDIGMFPNGVSSDWTDCLTQALIKARRIFQVENPDDPQEDDFHSIINRPRRSAYG